MLQLPASHLRMIQQQHLAEFESVAREKLAAQQQRAPGARRRLGRAVVRLGALIASEPRRSDLERPFEPVCE